MVTDVQCTADPTESEIILVTHVTHQMTWTQGEGLRAEVRCGTGIGHLFRSHCFLSGFFVFRFIPSQTSVKDVFCSIDGVYKRKKKVVTIKKNRNSQKWINDRNITVCIRTPSLLHKILVPPKIAIIYYLNISIEVDVKPPNHYSKSFWNLQLLVQYLFTFGHNQIRLCQKVK